MSNFLNTLIQISLIYCAIVFLILVFRRPMYRIAGAKWVYVMWFSLFVPLVVFVVPNAFPTGLSQLPVQEFSLSARISSIVSFETINIFAIVLLILWTCGVIATVWRTAQRNFKMVSDVRAKSQHLTVQQAKAVNHFCKKAGVYPAPEVRCYSAINGPALLGVFNPVLLLPLRFFEKFSHPEQALMVIHELVHFRRNDAWWNLFFCGLRCVFWFNPLIRLAERRFRLDQEMSCDRLVLLNEGSTQKISYAEAMIKVASPTLPQNLIGFRNNSPEILERITQLQHHKPSLLRSFFGPVGCALLLMVAALLSTPNIEGSYPDVVTSAWCSIYQGIGL